MAERLGPTLVTPKRIGIAGFVLGMLAFWVALPPIHVRNVVAPVILAALAVAAGIYATRAGEVRVGWGAIVIGFLGLGAAYLATRSNVENLEIVFTWSTLIASMFVFACPLMFASLGGIFSERSGVVNIGLEGMMLMGAFWGIWGADKTGNWVTGVLIGMAAGGLLGLLHAFFSVHLRADQIVGGTAINLLAIGITGYAFVQLYGTENIPAGVSEIPRLQMRFLDEIPLVGDFLYGAFGRLSVLIWIGFIFVLNVNSWFTLWSYRDLARWTIGQFLLLVLVPTLLYLAAHVSVPEIPEDTTQRYDMRAYYYERCRILLGLIALSILASLSAEYLLVDHELLTADNWIRLTGLAFLLAGLLSRRPWVHAGITLGALAIVAWSLGFVGHPLDQATR